MQTECPNCQAQFLVTQESLDIADGMVRCGQCDQVFDAEQNLIVVQNSTIEPPTAEEPSPIADSLPAESDLELIEIDFKNDDLDEASKLIDDDLNNNKVDPNDEDIYESLIDNSIQVSSSEESDFDFSLDEELLDSVLKDDFNTDQDINNSDFSLDEHMSEQSSETTSDETNTDAKEEFDTLDSDDDLLAELDQLEASYNDATTLGDSLSNNNSLDSGDSSSIENSLSSEDSYSVEDSYSAEDSYSVEDSISTDNSVTAQEASSIKFPEIEESIVMEDTSLPERKMPLETKDDPSYFKQSSFIKQSAGSLFSWFVACILLVLLLGAQYLHFNSNKLAQNTTYRPFLETLCPITQCELPLNKATRQIVTVDHDVYSHKVYENALEVQLTFKNKSNAPQAYPILEIIFSNPLGAVIAQRKFLPEDYIENKKLLSEGMKVNQSQKVKFDIIDPEPKAFLSFQFNYL